MHSHVAQLLLEPFQRVLHLVNASTKHIMSAHALQRSFRLPVPFRLDPHSVWPYLVSWTSPLDSLSQSHENLLWDEHVVFLDQFSTRTLIAPVGSAATLRENERPLPCSPFHPTSHQPVSRTNALSQLNERCSSFIPFQTPNCTASSESDATFQKIKRPVSPGPYRL